MTLKNIVYGLCFALGVGLATPAYARAEEGSASRTSLVQVAGESQAAKILGDNAELNYQANDPLLCFGFKPVNADDIQLTLEMNQGSAERKMNDYLGKVAPGNDAGWMTIVGEMGSSIINGKTVYAPVNPRACAHLAKYRPDIAEIILKDADPKERVLPDPYMSQAYNVNEVVTHSSCSSSGGCIEETPAVKAQTSYQAFKVTTHALPYVSKATFLMKGNGFTDDMVFKMLKGLAGADGVIDQREGRIIYETMIESIQKVKQDNGE